MREWQVEMDNKGKLLLLLWDCRISMLLPRHPDLRYSEHVSPHVCFKHPLLNSTCEPERTVVLHTG